MSVNRTRRLRSLSVSIDTECPRQSEGDMVLSSSAPTGKMVNLPDRSRAFSTCGIEQYESVFKDELNHACCTAKTCRRLQLMELPFNFQALPDVCKLKVFLLLGAKERGHMALVCHEWCSMVKCPSLWGIVDLTVFKLCYATSELHRECTILCYAAYKRRVTKFLQFLIAVKPIVTHVRFSLDLGDFSDSWIDLLMELFKVRLPKVLQVRCLLLKCICLLLFIMCHYLLVSYYHD